MHDDQQVAESLTPRMDPTFCLFIKMGKFHSNTRDIGGEWMLLDGKCTTECEADPRF